MKVPGAATTGRKALLAVGLCLAPRPVLASDPGPVAPPSPQALPAPRDHPFHGTIVLDVDATDTARKLVRVRETVPVQAPGPLVLFYPRWEIASHAPTGPVWDLAGLQIWAGNRSVAWRRDPIDPYAFHLDVPPGATTLALSFEYISPPSGVVEITPDLLALTWSRTLLYPAGWYARNIPVRASVALPHGFQAASALDPDRTVGDTLSFAPVPLETLADSPLYAGRHALHLDLAPGAATPVSAVLFADSGADLALDPARLDRLRAGIRAVQGVFGRPHYNRYTMLVSLSDHLAADGGLEHQASAEINLPAGFLRDPHRLASDETLFTHEYVHSWNGVSRQGEGLWTPDFNTPKRTDSLWIYEGQTELWGVVLAARAGLLARDQALDLLAVYAATQQNRVGRRWKTLSDTDNDPVYMIGHAIPDRDWQRREDYYGGGLLLWLDVAMKLRRLSDDRVGLDDFAHRFFGGDDPGTAIRTYRPADIPHALNALAPSDWAALLSSHLDAHDDSQLLDGLAEGGYRLRFDPTPTAIFTQETAGTTDLSYSLGLVARPDGRIAAVSWDGPAFAAGLAPGNRIDSVNNQPFTPAALLAATDASATTPVTLGLHADDAPRTVTLSYRGPLRFPRLERIPGTADRLGAFLSPRP